MSMPSETLELHKTGARSYLYVSNAHLCVGSEVQIVNAGGRFSIDLQ